ncbi:MAG: hypothetical protein AB7H97_07780 [Pseudobdellovibrionaceae bacterium]|jgi:hypothetical protein
MNKTENSKQRPNKIVFFIDAEKFETEQKELSVRTLLAEYAKEDPNKTTLALKDGRELIKFTDLAQLIKMKDGMKFIVLHNDPTPVS